MKTYVPKQDEIKHDWFVVDASDVVLGRLSTQGGDTAARQAQAVVHPGARHRRLRDHRQRGAGEDDRQQVGGEEVLPPLRRPGHLHTATARELRDSRPERIVRYAVWGMLPKNRLGRQLLKKLKVYAGPEHPHQAQMPQPIKVKE